MMNNGSERMYNGFEEHSKRKMKENDICPITTITPLTISITHDSLSPTPFETSEYLIPVTNIELGDKMS
jgi:hypothetical protein